MNEPNITEKCYIFSSARRRSILYLVVLYFVCCCWLVLLWLGFSAADDDDDVCVCCRGFSRPLYVCIARYFQLVVNYFTTLCAPYQSCPAYILCKQGKTFHQQTRDFVCCTDGLFRAQKLGKMIFLNLQRRSHEP